MEAMCVYIDALCLHYVYVWERLENGSLFFKHKLNLCFRLNCDVNNVRTNIRNDKDDVVNW